MSAMFPASIYPTPDLTSAHRLTATRHRSPRLLCETRERILVHILAHPGQRRRDLIKGLGLAPSTISYHLRQLQREGLLSTPQKLIIPRSCGPRAPERIRHGRLVLEKLVGVQPATVAQLAARTGLGETAVRACLKALEAVHWVQGRKLTAGSKLVSYTLVEEARP
jgi:predicted ArsR family transcriptional regulator